VAEILVAFDDTEHSRAALDLAARTAHERRAHLTVLSVLDLPLDPNAPRAYGTAGDGPAAHGPYAIPDRIAEVLAEARRRLTPLGATATYVWAAGPPAEIIVETAQARRADAIVLGQGHHGLLGTLFGTDVAREVEEHAGCEVLTPE